VLTAYWSRSTTWLLGVLSDRLLGAKQGAVWHVGMTTWTTGSRWLSNEMGLSSPRLTYINHNGRTAIPVYGQLLSQVVALARSLESEARVEHSPNVSTTPMAILLLSKLLCQRRIFLLHTCLQQESPRPMEFYMYQRASQLKSPDTERWGRRR